MAEKKRKPTTARGTLRGLQPVETTNVFSDESSYHELSDIAEQAMRRAEVARLRELTTLKGHMEIVVKMKGIEIDSIEQNYTV